MNLPKWQIKGDFGYGTRILPVSKKQGNATSLFSSGAYAQMDGYMIFTAFHNFIEMYLKENMYRIRNPKSGGDGSYRGMVRLAMFNLADAFQDYWYVEPEKLPDKIRSATRPLSYDYDISFVGIEPYMEADPEIDDLARIIGNVSFRRQYIKDVLEAWKPQWVKLLEKVMNAIEFAQDLYNAINEVLDGVNEAIDYLKDKITGAVEFVGNIDTILEDFVAKLRSVLDNLWSLLAGDFTNDTANDLANISRQTLCAIQTLQALPKDEYNALWASLFTSYGSGCGTTLRPTTNTTANAY
jgi:hypothetical protein